jgi:phosphoribosyl-ATP pyrophosphohydrolase
MTHKKREKLPGYHLKNIPRGELGKSSKILEEVLELIDAEEQHCKVMTMVELSDLVGAIHAYVKQNAISLTISDLEVMAMITKRAFTNGRRVGK